MIGCLPKQALAFLAVFVYATQAIAFEWKPGLSLLGIRPQFSSRTKLHREKDAWQERVVNRLIDHETFLLINLSTAKHTGIRPLLPKAANS